MANEPGERQDGMTPTGYLVEENEAMIQWH